MPGEDTGNRTDDEPTESLTAEERTGQTDGDSTTPGVRDRANTNERTTEEDTPTAAAASDAGNEAASTPDSSTHPSDSRDDEGVSTDSGGDTGKTDDGDNSLGDGVLRRAVPTLLGVDMVARLGPEVLDTIGSYLLGATRLSETVISETAVVLFGYVVQYPDIVWGVSWLALVTIAMLYVPELVRPERPDWPAGVAGRLLFAVPVVAAGLLTEAVFRRVLATAVSETTAPVAVPLTPVSVGGTLLAVLGLFAWVYHDSCPDASPRNHSLSGYLTRATVLLIVLGIFFASFSLLSPYSELFVFALYGYARWSMRADLEGMAMPVSASDAASDPAERLVKSAATIWERPAQVAVSLYVTGALTIVVWALLAARVRVPADMLARAPWPMAYLVIIGAALLLYTVFYCERAMRPFRLNYTPDSEPASAVAGEFFPVTILLSLLLSGYVFGDPLVLPGTVELITGLLTATGVPLMIGGVGPIFNNVYGTPEENALETEVEDDDLRVWKKVTLVEDGRATKVTFRLTSEYTVPLSVEVEETVPFWARPGFVHEVNSPTEWEFRQKTLRFETTIQATGSETIEYTIATPESVTSDELLRGFTTSTAFLSASPSDSKSDSETTVETDDRATIGAGSVSDSDDTEGDTETIDGRPSPGSPASGRQYAYNMPMYHLPPIVIGVFTALLAAPAPLSGQYVVTDLLDGSLLKTNLVGTLLRSTATFLLVILPYVPLGAMTHQRHLEELYDNMDVNVDTGPDQWDSLSYYTGIGVVALLAIGVALLDVPGLASVFEQGVVAVLSGVVVVMIIGSPDDRMLQRGWSLLKRLVIYGLMFTILSGLLSTIFVGIPLAVLVAVVYVFVWLLSSLA